MIKELRLRKEEIDQMKKIVRKSAIPIYGAAGAWILYALVFPLYKVSHFVGAILFSGAVGFILWLIFRKKVEVIEVPEKPVEPETTGNEALDNMLNDGRLAIQEFKRLDENIADEKISADIVKLEDICEKIFAKVKEEPKKLPQIRKFMNYYLPTTIKLLNAYDSMANIGVEGENISTTKNGVEGIMDNIVKAFEKQLDSLYGDQAMDISTDIIVLENMMAREGFVDDPIHKRPQEAPADK